MIIGKGIIADRFIEYQRKTDLHIVDFTLDSKKISPTEMISAMSGQTGLTLFFVTQKEQAWEQIGVQVKNGLKSGQSFLIGEVPHVIGVSQDQSSFFEAFLEKRNGHKTTDQVEYIDVDTLFEECDQLIHHLKIKKNIVFKLKETHQISISDLEKEIELFLNKKTAVSADTPLSDIQKILLKYYGQKISGQKKLISVVVPAYYSESSVFDLHQRLKNVFLLIKDRFDYEIIVVNDGSKDKTLPNLLEVRKKESNLKIISFSKNFGNQIAIAAGLEKAKGDLVVVIDDDLQDPPEVILSMIAKWHEGFKVVYGVRRTREGVGWFFKKFAEIYYQLLNKLSDTAIPVNTGDFRLMDRCVVTNLVRLKEENRYYRGLVPWMGFSQYGLLYDRDRREKGRGNFNFFKYLEFAAKGLTSFSDKPLYISSYIGFFVTVSSFLFMAWILISKLFDSSFSIQGWPSLVAIILFLGGVQLSSIGVLGIYMSKVYREVKNRPLYVIEQQHGFD